MFHSCIYSIVLLTNITIFIQPDLQPTTSKSMASAKQKTMDRKSKLKGNTGYESEDENDQYEISKWKQSYEGKKF